MIYRKEIDGLRAVSVLAVIFCHAGLGWAEGGFVGVDIFFVISGYLITTILLKEIEEKRFSIVAFYERRARRILPALLFVILACIPVAWVMLSPQQLETFFKSIAAVAMFGANLFFWNESGYFSAAAEEMPLLHTWSLAVEEQFYLLFPLLLLLLARVNRKYLLPALLLIAAMSLGLAEYGWRKLPGLNFYISPTRAWELLAGSCIAVPCIQKSAEKVSRWTAEIVSLMGVVAIGYAVATYDSSTPIPSVWALPPIMGAVAIILFANPKNIAGRLLCTRPLVKIGVISYSAYLWHQPLFAFARLSTAEHIPTWVFILLSVLTLVLAHLSWKFVEIPFRNRKVLTRRRVLAGSGAGIAVMVLIGVLGVQSKGFPDRFNDAAILAASVMPEEYSANCQWTYPVAGSPSIRMCNSMSSGADTGTVFLYGDSHARVLVPSLQAELKKQRLNLAYVQNSDCEYIPETFVAPLTSARVDTCRETHEALLDYMDSNNPEAVIVMLRWTMRLYPVPGAIESPGFDNGEGGVEHRQKMPRYGYENGEFTVGADAKEHAITALVNQFVALDVPVIVTYPVPEAGWNLKKLNWIDAKKHGFAREEITTDYTNYLSRNSFVIDALDSIKSGPSLHRLYPEKLFCSAPDSESARCLIQENSTPYYTDADHLSAAGSKKVVTEILGIIDPVIYASNNLNRLEGQ